MNKRQYKKKLLKYSPNSYNTKDETEIKVIKVIKRYCVDNDISWVNYNLELACLLNKYERTRNEEDHDKLNRFIACTIYPGLLSDYLCILKPSKRAKESYSAPIDWIIYKPKI